MLQKTNTTRISVVITKDDLERIDYVKEYEEEFSDTKLTRSDAIRECIREYAYHCGYNKNTMNT